MENSIDIEYIINLVKEQEPERMDLLNALLNCKGGEWTSNGYFEFVNSDNANQTGSEWQHEECIVIEQKDKGDLVIDLLQDGRVGGIEFLDLID